MASLQPIRGTYDILYPDILRHRHVEDTALAVASRYGFQEIQTPIFESTAVFARTLGETSDIVTKEMYTFNPPKKTDEFITLRPENTAGVARAFISNGMAQQLPAKLFYRGPMFRYERPQKGRQRQFHQVGVELLGIDKPLADVEVIALGAALLRDLGLDDAATLELNTLGDTESRAAYRETLVGYLSRYESDLSTDSKERLAKNPMRILDSKDEGDQKIVADAPLILDCLNTESRAFYDAVCDGLTALGIGFTANPRLVRGLDYYCHTAFEFTTDRLGAQSAVLAGGRYDGLVKQMGGPQTPGIGWAAGVERLALLCEQAPDPIAPIAVVPVGDDCISRAFEIAEALRRAGLTVDMAYSGNVKKRMNRANKVGAKTAIMLGTDELDAGQALVRDMESGEQVSVPLNQLTQYLQQGM